MAVTQIQRKTLTEHVYEELFAEITSEEIKPGERLPSMSNLADGFGTSINPVQRALDRLAEEGYVEKRPGSGTYVIDSSTPAGMSDTVVLCLRSEAHVWGQLSHLLADRLHHDRLMPLLVNPKNENAPEMLRGLARSEARAFVVRGTPFFPTEMFASPPFHNKIVVGLVEWATDSFPGLLRVLADRGRGGRMLARRFHREGHRKALMIAPRLEAQKMRNMLRGVPGEVSRRHYGVACLREWERLGGRWEITNSTGPGENGTGLVELEEKDLLSRLRADEPPSVVFGWRDVEAAAAQNIISGHAPDLLDYVEMAGFYDTPWSRNARPPFTTVNLNLETIVDEACEVIEARLRGEEIDPPTLWVKPRLVVR
jgi:DNA-binding LacI/PurR family transcriptional regulator